MSPPGVPSRASRPVWRADVPDLVACVRAAASTDVFLHLPKTAGLAVAEMASRAPDWHSVLLRGPSGRPSCWCGVGGSPGCRCVGSADPVAVGTAGATGRHLQVSVGHSTFGQVAWLRRRLARGGTAATRTVTVVRPVRDRLRSMFGFYWRGALDPWPEEELASWRADIREVLLTRQADAEHYRRPDGSVDGAAWFAAFAVYTGGVNFFLADVFGSPRTLARALDRGLVVVPSAGLVDFGRATYGIEPRRVNESGAIQDDPRIVAALAAAEAEIEVCARRDDPFDAVLADHLDDPSFRR